MKPDRTSAYLFQRKGDLASEVKLRDHMEGDVREVRDRRSLDERVCILFDEQHSWLLFIHI